MQNIDIMTYIKVAYSVASVNSFLWMSAEIHIQFDTCHSIQDMHPTNHLKSTTVLNILIICSRKLVVSVSTLRLRDLCFKFFDNIRIN